MRINWEDYYQIQPTDSVVTSSQQHPQTLRDSRTARTTIKPQNPLQEKNIQLRDYIQIKLQPADKTAKAKKKNKLSNP